MAKKTKIKEQDIDYDKTSLYFGYSSRVSILIVLFSILAIICALLGYKLLYFQEENYIKFIEVGKISHKAILKNNNIYNTNVIKENDNITYLSSLTDKIKLNYKYKINFDKKVTGKYTTKIVGELSIYNQKTNSKYYIKQYDLGSNEEYTFESKKIVYTKDILVDYSKYNALATEFKSKYSKDSKAKFDVYLVIDTTLSPMDNPTYKKVNSKVLATIPLGENEIDIIKSPIDNYREIPFKQTKVTIYSIILEILIIILIIAIIVVFIKLNNLLSKLQIKETEYDKELKRILTEYDNYIVNVSILPDENEYKKVVIKEFDELLDLRENTKEPIRYIEIAPRNKSYFFIKHNEEVFIYTLKNISKER